MDFFVANVAQIVFVAVPSQFAIAPQPYQPQIAVQVPIAPADKVYIPPQPVQVLEESKYYKTTFCMR